MRSSVVEHLSYFCVLTIEIMLVNTWNSAQFMCLPGWDSGLGEIRYMYM